MVPKKFQLPAEYLCDLLETHEQAKAITLEIAEDQIDDRELSAFIWGVETQLDYLNKIQSNVYTTEENNQLIEMATRAAERSLETLENSGIAGILTQNQHFNMSDDQMAGLKQMYRKMVSGKALHESPGEVASILKSAVKAIKEGKACYANKLAAMGDQALTLENLKKHFLTTEKGVYDIVDIGWASSMTSYITMAVEVDPETAEKAHAPSCQATVKLLM